MVVPEVDKKVLEELEGMGFSTARATRALHCSGNASLETAVNWIVEHENDPDIDQMPMMKRPIVCGEKIAIQSDRRCILQTSSNSVYVTSFPSAFLSFGCRNLEGEIGPDYAIQVKDFDFSDMV